MQVETDHPASLEEQAAVWLTRRTSGHWTSADQIAFDEWIGESAAHAAAYRSAEDAWETIGRDQELAGLAAARNNALPYPSESRAAPASWISAVFRWWPGWAFAGAAAASVGLVVVLTDPLQPSFTEYLTQTAVIEEVTLPDGTRIDLAPASRIRVAFSDKRRAVTLLEGEAFFDVAKDQARAFVVTAADTEIIVTGTAFNVHRSPSAVTIAVAEGSVNVRIPSIDGDFDDVPAPSENVQSNPVDSVPSSKVETVERMSTAAAALTAGQQVVAKAGVGLRPVAEVAPDMAGAWRTGHLVYMDNRLIDVVADINRYSETPIALESDAVAEMRIAAALPTTAIDTMLNMVDNAVPVRVDYECAGRIIIRHRDSADTCAPA